MRQNFADNKDFIDHHNSLNSSYTLGLNQFSGMSFEEWKAYMGLDHPQIPFSDGNHSIHTAPADGFYLP